jgi:hypothetical protein
MYCFLYIITVNDENTEISRKKETESGREGTDLCEAGEGVFLH